MGSLTGDDDGGVGRETGTMRAKARDDDDDDGQRRDGADGYEDGDGDGVRMTTTATASMSMEEGDGGGDSARRHVFDPSRDDASGYATLQVMQFNVLADALAANDSFASG